MPNTRLRMVGGKRYRPKIGKVNIDKTEFIDKWPNGRPFKHGAMKISFIFSPASCMSAELDVEAIMGSNGYERGKDYNIPSWNFSRNYGKLTPYIGKDIIITFNDIDTFIMAKLGWD